MVQYSQGYVSILCILGSGSGFARYPGPETARYGPSPPLPALGPVLREILDMRMFDTLRPDTMIEVNEPKGPWGRMRGLIGSTGLGEGLGMLLKTRQVHTFGMTYPIDAIYLSRQGRVLKVVTLRPARMGPLVWSARWVLEMRAGEAARLGIGEGTSLSKEPP